MVGLNTVFKQVFSEGLKDQGFQKIKGRQPYLVRVVEGGEIIHVISCRNRWLGEAGYKAFEILGSAETVYRHSFDLTDTPSQNITELETLADMYVNTDFAIGKDNYYREISKFIYKQEDEDSLREQMKRALTETKKVMIPVFDKTVNLEACLDYFRRHGSFMLEFLLYIKTDNHDDFIELCEKMIAEKMKAVEAGYYNTTIEKVRKLEEEWRLNTIARRDRIYNDPELYAETLEKLECRRIANQEALRALGLKI